MLKPGVIKRAFRFAGLIFLLANLAACSLGERVPVHEPVVSPTAATATALPSPAPTLTPAATSTPTGVSGAAPTTSTDSLSAAARAGCPVTQAPEVDPSATLVLGPAEGIPRSTASGEELVIEGRVYADDCTPLPGASLHVWQTDPAGEYGPGHGGQEMQCCYLQGEVQTDSNGYYKLVTLKPGHYKGQDPPPPAHIHVEIGHPEAQGEMLEIVFAGDPYLVSPTASGLVVVNLETAAPVGAGQPYLYGVADIVLPRSQAVPEPSPEGASTGARTFQILPESSEAAYQIREKFAVLPLSTSAVGLTHQVEGSLSLDFSSLQPLKSMQVEVDLRGLSSDDPNRDEKLVDRWLVTQQFPYAYFTGQRIENGPESITEGQPVSFTLLGDLTIRDVTRPASFEVTARLDGNRIIGTASTVVKMTDFGIDPPDLLGMVTVEDEVRLTINLVAEETATETGG